MLRVKWCIQPGQGRAREGLKDVAGQMSETKAWERGGGWWGHLQPAHCREGSVRVARMQAVGHLQTAEAAEAWCEMRRISLS